MQHIVSVHFIQYSIWLSLKCHTSQTQQTMTQHDNPLIIITRLLSCILLSSKQGRFCFQQLKHAMLHTMIIILKLGVIWLPQFHSHMEEKLSVDGPSTKGHCQGEKRVAQRDKEKMWDRQTGSMVSV